jgi:tellurite resistance protein TerA
MFRDFYSYHKKGGYDMELKQKHAQAYVEGFKELIVTIVWSSGADFDLAAAYEAKDGTKRVV